jgi:hypothetical protein
MYLILDSNNQLIGSYKSLHEALMILQRYMNETKKYAYLA